MKPVTKTIAAALIVCALSIFLYTALRDKPASHTPEAPAPTAQQAGHFITDNGIEDAVTGDIVLEGNYTEAVTVRGYLLATDKDGTLQLVRLSDRAVISMEKPEYAYQLKVVGDDFGYLQQDGNAQFVTFLDPETGETAAMDTGDNVITWDAHGDRVVYQPYESTTIGFAEYDDELGWGSVQELDSSVGTIGQIFSYHGNDYVWLIHTDSTHAVYDLKTRTDVSDEFPVISKLDEAQGVLSEVVGDYWILRAAGIESAGSMSYQIWATDAELTLNLTLSGYSFSGHASLGDEGIYVPVSYTNGQIADGLLMLESDNDSTFIEGKREFVSEDPQKRP